MAMILQACLPSSGILRTFLRLVRLILEVMFLWKKGATDICPRCLQEVEDAIEGRQYQGPRVLTIWTQSIARLEVWMTKQQSQRGIIRAVCAKTLVSQR
jgi:hypothetical protein